MLRFIICVGLFVGALCLLIRGNRDGYDLLLLPMLGILPAALFTGVVLSPIERYALTHNRVAHLVWALPLAGLAFPFVAVIVLALFAGKPSAIIEIFHIGGDTVVLAEAGLGWGVLWWMTGMAARLGAQRDTEQPAADLEAVADELDRGEDGEAR